MASLLEDCRTYYIAGGALATYVSLLAVWKYMKRKAAERRKAYPANTVILHQPPRGPNAPSFSPFPLKLETYLRMAKIPYQNAFGFEKGPEGKFPFLIYNGEDLADSQFCIDFLNKKFHKDPNSHLNKEQRAVARSMRQMVEGSLFWVFAIQFWVYNDGTFKVIRTAAPNFPVFIWKFIQRGYKGYAHSQGYGRHTAEEVYSIGRGDLQALSDLLGGKAFLMGDQPCEEDCAVFGLLAQFNWHGTGTPLDKIFKEFPNLSDYCERMKDRFWPDWDECNTAGGTRKATK